MAAWRSILRLSFYLFIYHTVISHRSSNPNLFLIVYIDHVLLLPAIQGRRDLTSYTSLF
jgi:hypothetical protein